MDERVYLKNCSEEGTNIRLNYHDGTSICVPKEDFDRLLGSLVYKPDNKAEV